ncbi:hypothetical protein, partial [Kitasatospora griseola]|uniref:hypothetical protein n=1 Tax=Kitasatospora griseola TaxID=2064 RepID=UPI001E2FB4D5
MTAEQHALARLPQEATPAEGLEVQLAVHGRVTESDRHRDGPVLRQHPGELDQDSRLPDPHPADQHIRP